MDSPHPLLQLIMARVRQFFREPEAIFWTYGFPLLMVVGLGIAFKNKPADVFDVTVVAGADGGPAASALSADQRFKVQVAPAEQAYDRLRRNRTPLVVAMLPDGSCEYHYDDSNPDSRMTRAVVDDALQRAAGRRDVLAVHDHTVAAPGSRYIDFLVPGLIGMNLMGGGMWGIGFVLVDMRVRNLLKRLLATPMRRSHFLLSMVGSRALFFFPEMAVLILFSVLFFDVPVRGHPLALVVVALCGTLAFAGLGLLTASRAQRIESISGLMNLVMLPMWLMSGIFFSSDRFPDALQPFIKALPLTQLINALREIMLEGAGLGSQLVPLGVLTLWGGVSFVLALRWFRWG